MDADTVIRATFPPILGYLLMASRDTFLCKATMSLDINDMLYQ